MLRVKITYTLNICSSPILYISHLLDDGPLQGLSDFMVWKIRQHPLHDSKLCFYDFMAFRCLRKLFSSKEKRVWLCYQL